MSSGQQMPPWLQEQVAKMQQSQQNLQSILGQKQQVEMENTESDQIPHLRANLNSTLRLIQASYDSINSVKI